MCSGKAVRRFSPLLKESNCKVSVSSPVLLLLHHKESSFLTYKIRVITTNLPKKKNKGKQCIKLLSRVLAQQRHSKLSLAPLLCSSLSAPLRLSSDFTTHRKGKAPRRTYLMFLLDLT